MTTVTAAAWVAWAISNRRSSKISQREIVRRKSGGFDWSPRSLAKNLVFAA